MPAWCFCDRLGWSQVFSAFWLRRVRQQRSVAHASPRAGKKDMNLSTDRHACGTDMCAEGLQHLRRPTRPQKTYRAWEGPSNCCARGVCVYVKSGALQKVCVCDARSSAKGEWGVLWRSQNTLLALSEGRPNHYRYRQSLRRNPIVIVLSTVVIFWLVCIGSPSGELQLLLSRTALLFFGLVCIGSPSGEVRCLLSRTPILFLLTYVYRQSPRRMSCSPVHIYLYITVMWLSCWS